MAKLKTATNRRLLTENYKNVKSVTVPNVTNPPLKVLLQRMANNGETLPDGFLSTEDDYSDIYTMDAFELVEYRRSLADEVTHAKQSFHHATRALAEKKQSSKEDATPVGDASAASTPTPEGGKTP